MKTIVGGVGSVNAAGNNILEIENNIFNFTISPSKILNRFCSTYTKDYPVYLVNKEILSQKKDDESYGFLFLRLALKEAMENAKLSIYDLKNVRVAVVIGTSVNASFNCFDFYKEYKTDKISSYNQLLYYFKTPLSKALCDYLNIDAIQMTITTACASGTDAIGIASQMIENDLCDIAIAGGTDEINLIPYTGFIRLLIASKKPCAPFSKDRQGINLGEGAGVVILESQKFARKRKTIPYGYILGYGNCCDAYHPTAPDPQGRGLTNAINTALKQANIKKDDIAFINAHATATHDNDLAEAKVFNTILKGVNVIASKSYTGHTLGAAGAIEAVLSLICLNRKEIPKAANFSLKDEELNLVPVLKNTKFDKHIALSDSLAFGGINSVLILGDKNV